MSETREDPPANLFGSISETDRLAALDIFGKLLIGARDTAIVQWGQTFTGRRKYAPWDRLMEKFPDIDERAIAILRDALPNVVDTFLYCMLADLEATRAVRISVEMQQESVGDVAGLSWGLPAEPTGEKGWLARFSTQRFEQPY